MTKKQREQRALEAIIAGVLRGFGKSDWQKVFRKMAEMERQKKLAERKHQAEHGGDIYGS